MVLKKAMTCLAIFLILLAWGWAVNERYQSLHYRPSVHSSYSTHASFIEPFGPREYVKIRRKPVLINVPEPGLQP
ncbi:hypothetical protein [Marinicrinis sediminis]|uniref:Uncharacterized protein n=1 Tax=Marinicrinis sediminis TaxID=1652465 RepID=A0ABW5R5W2_9BACL